MNRSKKQTRRLFLPLLIELRNMPTDDALERLWNEGLIDMLAIERRAIARAVRRYVRKGELKYRAMERAAFEFDCSYEKVRRIVYRDSKQ